MPDTGVPRALPIWLTALLGLAAASITIWGLHAAATFVAPILLAFVLTVVAHPLVPALTRRGVPRGVAVAILVLAIDGGLIAFTLAVVVSVGQLATILPQYSDQWQQALDGVRATLTGLGLGADQGKQMVSAIGPGPVIAAVGDLLKATLGALGALVLVLVTTLFMAVDGSGLPDRLAAVPRVSPGLRAALHQFASSTRRYIVVSTVFGFAVAVVDTAALYVMGIPLPLLWGLLSFLTNYVPNIGFLLGLVPPALLGFLVGGPWLGVLVIVVYCVVNFLIQSVLQPVVVGDAVGLAVTLTFLSTILWTVIIGPIGAVLAIPLTLLTQAILVGQDPDRRWARVLLAGTAGPLGDRAAGGVRHGGDRRSPLSRARWSAVDGSAHLPRRRVAQRETAAPGVESLPVQRPRPDSSGSPTPTG